jgi:hypothetical protein
MGYGGTILINQSPHGDLDIINLTMFEERYSTAVKKT